MSRSYDYAKYNKQLKQDVRYMVENMLLINMVPYVEYFIPVSLAVIYEQGPIIYSYLTQTCIDSSRLNLFTDNTMYELISQAIVTRLIDLFFEHKKKNIQSITYKEKEHDISDTPNGFYYYPSVIPEQVCYNYRMSLSRLYENPITKNVKFSMTGDFETWGDIPPEIISCLYYTLSQELNIVMSLQLKNGAIFIKQKEFNINASTITDNEDLIIVCFSDTKLDAVEQIHWGYKYEKTFSTIIPKGSVIILKREAYYTWKYYFSNNEGMLIYNYNK
jgi:hypothetical protein